MIKNTSDEILTSIMIRYANSKINLQDAWDEMYSAIEYDADTAITAMDIDYLIANLASNGENWEVSANWTLAIRIHVLGIDYSYSRSFFWTWH